VRAEGNFGSGKRCCFDEDAGEWNLGLRGFQNGTKGAYPYIFERVRKWLGISVLWEYGKWECAGS